MQPPAALQHVDRVMRTVREDELRAHNGENGTRLWIAESGMVYDVTDCPKWRTGMHEQTHFAGLDLSGELPDAPHDRDVLSRPCVTVVGQLDSGAGPEG